MAFGATGAGEERGEVVKTRSEPIEIDGLRAYDKGETIAVRSTSCTSNRPTYGRYGSTPVSSRSKKSCWLFSPRARRTGPCRLR